ncbi:hypothetical protein GGR51DRAFT_576160 [Nemania sp. FL0031]|nr:hypothetical protein GGR51DRAFT_576160 [Nemania sp. FL0031]
MSRPKDAPPGSPWLNRFEGFHEGFSRPGYFFEWDGVQHSGFAPELPKVADPKYYLEPPNRLPNSGVPSDEELDRMFRTEEHQAATLRGMTTYQINSMNRWVQFTPELPPMSGGHLQSDSTPAAQAEAARVWREYGIKVDESKWFSFFRKERWCDWTSTSPPSKKEGIKWSMDDPKLFEAFSPALELANRVLQTLVDQKHPTEPFEEPMVFVSQEMEVKLAEKYNTEVPKDEAASRDKSEWKERLEGLLEMVIWSFFDSKLIAEGLTHMTVEHCIPAIITMDINRLPPLMDPTITIAERVRLLFKVSCTIVHELTHALVACRLNNYVPGSFEDHKNNGRAVRTHDIIVDFQGVAEAGLHVENAYYGGIHHFTLAGLPITSITHEAPSGMLKRLYAFVPGPWSEDGASFKSTYVQSSYASRLLSEAWWQDPDLPVRSLDYFHKPYTFTSEARTGELRWDPPTIQEPEASDLYYGPNKRDFDTWNEREALRNTIREEWYDMEFGFWLSSPWSYTDYMLFINDFAKPFAEKDEVKCATLAEQLVRATVNWKNPDKYWDNFPQNEWDTETTYMHHCIGK